MKPFAIILNDEEIEALYDHLRTDPTEALDRIRICLGTELGYITGHPFIEYVDTKRAQGDTCVTCGRTRERHHYVRRS